MDKRAHKDMPLVAFTNATNIFCPVNNLATEEIKRAPTISKIECESKQYRKTNKAAAPFPYALYNPNHNEVLTT